MIKKKQYLNDLSAKGAYLFQCWAFERWGCVNMKKQTGITSAQWVHSSGVSGRLWSTLAVWHRGFVCDRNSSLKRHGIKWPVGFQVPREVWAGVVCRLWGKAGTVSVTLCFISLECLRSTSENHPSHSERFYVFTNCGNKPEEKLLGSGRT